jgi:hypothetical protein
MRIAWRMGVTRMASAFLLKEANARCSCLFFPSFLHATTCTSRSRLAIELVANSLSHSGSPLVVVQSRTSLHAHLASGRHLCRPLAVLLPAPRAPSAPLRAVRSPVSLSCPPRCAPSARRCPCLVRPAALRSLAGVPVLSAPLRAVRLPVSCLRLPCAPDARPSSVPVLVPRPVPDLILGPVPVLVLSPVVALVPDPA